MGADDNRRSLGVTLAPLERVYRVRAELANGDSNMIVTSSRERAIRYHRLFQLSTSYTNPTIELGSTIYTAETLEALP